MKTILVGLCLSFLFSLGTAQQSSQQRAQKQSSVDVASKPIYSCPMHPEVTSDKPGKCSKCGMALVASVPKAGNVIDVKAARLTDSAARKIHEAKNLLEEAKMGLAQEGKYNCCIKAPCDRCALDHEICACADLVKKGEAVCPDCYAGWQRGDGIVKGVNPKKVKGGFHRHGDVH